MTIPCTTTAMPGMTTMMCLGTPPLYMWDRRRDGKHNYTSNRERERTWRLSSLQDGRLEKIISSSSTSRRAFLVSAETGSRERGNLGLKSGEKGRRGREEKDDDDAERVSLPRNVDYISSLGNAYVKHLVKLRRNAATRVSTSSVLVLGSIPLREICENIALAAAGLQGESTPVINVLLVRENANIPETLTRFAQRSVHVSAGVMGKITGLDSPPEAIGVLSFPASFTSLERHQNGFSATSQLQRWCPSPCRILVLDAIQDPGNLGTLIRTAAAFAWDGLFLLPGCCDPFNEKALRAARGASFRVRVAVGEWHHLREFAKSNNLQLFAGDPELEGAGSQEEIGDGLSIASSGTEGLCLVLGSEGQGLSQEIARDCRPIGIPMPGKFESLNVAVAGGILMFLLR